jgi:hypothetical protein
MIASSKRAFIFIYLISPNLLPPLMYNHILTYNSYKFHILQTDLLVNYEASFAKGNGGSFVFPWK